MMILPGQVLVFADDQKVAVATAEWLVALAGQITNQDKQFYIALSGGSTPLTMYAWLTQEPYVSQITWEKWQLYFGDERAVDPTGPLSNYYQAYTHFISKVPIKDEQVHRIQGENKDLESAAQTYSELLEQNLPSIQGKPRFDCILLGIGEDGHTASLFPNNAALEITDRWATTSTAPVTPHDRITLSYPCINAAANIAFIASGAKKHQALLAVSQGTVPASKIKPTMGKLFWFLDKAATH